MRYRLTFKESALKEWQAFDGSVRAQFKKVLLRRLDSPRVESAKLTGMPDCYKIKLRATGYRLVYEVVDATVAVVVVAVGKRERNEVYAAAMQRRERK